MTNIPDYDPTVDLYTTIVVILFWVFIGVIFYIQSQKKKERRRKINDLWRRFAAEKDLTEEKFDASLYWYGIFKNLNFKAQIKEIQSSRSTTLKRAGRRNLAFRGQYRGFPCALETVTVSVGESVQLYTRISLEIPGIPKTLTLRPKALAELNIGRMVSRRNKAIQVESFDQDFFVKGTSTNEVKTFLTDDRRSAIVDFSNGNEEVHIQDGKLFLLRKGQVDNIFELDQLYSRVGELGCNLSKGLKLVLKR